MEQQELKQFMTFNKDGEAKIPLAVFEVNGSYVVGVYLERQSISTGP